MPKKFAGENSKAVAARSRKEATKEAEKSKKSQAEEDAKWRDDDKNLMKKQQKKDDQEKKRLEQLQKKAEAKALLEQEMNSIKKTTKPPPPAKVTRAQIESRSAQNRNNKPVEKKVVETHLDKPVEENINRIVVEGEEARSVTEAIAILGVKDDGSDKHPEKRMKAAYTAYEERRLAELKLEHPSLRLSQLKQMIFKEWQKSPDNPLNKLQQ